MQKNEAAWISAKHAKLEVKEAPLWTPKAGEVLIRNQSVAVNPCDWKIQEWGIFVQDEDYPFILGVDVAGTIEAVGEGVMGLAKGDRVLAYGASLTSNAQSKSTLEKVQLDADPRFGTFQKFSIVYAHLVTKIPDFVSFDDACVLPTGAATAAHGIFSETHLNLERPTAHKNPALANKSVLVWGAASSVGACAVQLIANAGYTVIATASASNHELVLSMGAARVFDYKDADVVEKLKAAVQGEWIGAFDAISAGGTMEQSAAVIGKGLLITTLPPPSGVLPSTITAKGVFAGMLVNVEKDIGSWLFSEYFVASLKDRSFKLTPPPLVIGRGLDKLQEGLEAQKTVSARKVVIQIGGH